MNTNIKNEVVHNWFAAFTQKDISLLQLHEDFSHTSPFGTVESRDAYLGLVKANTDKFFTDDIQVIDVIENQEASFVRYVVNGMPACDCIYIQDGLIKHIRSYYHFGEPPSM